jgi:hypothetical protein
MDGEKVFTRGCVFFAPASEKIFSAAEKYFHGVSSACVQS